MVTYYLCFLVLFTPSATAQVKSDTLLSLQALIQEALQANPVLQASRLAAAAQRTRSTQARAWPDPSLEVSYRPLALGGLDGAVPASLMLMQEVPFPGKRTLEGKSAFLEAEAMVHEADAQALKLVYALRTTYYELYRLGETRRLIEAFRERLAAFAEAATVRYEVGQESQAAVLRLQLERHTLTQRLLALQEAWQTQFAYLRQLTGRADWPDTLALVPPALPTVFPVVPIEEALRRNPEALALTFREQQAYTELQRARRDFWPDLVLGVGLMDMMNTPVAPLHDLGARLSIRFGVVLPLQRPRRAAYIEETQLTAKRWAAQYADLRNQLTSRFRALQAQFAAAQASLMLLEQTLLPQARTTREALLSAYTTGQASYLDLLDAERALFELEHQRLETFTRLLVMAAEADMVLGILPQP
jgi:cobalt-zinc-cadmium efflux system outer membrane protein